MLPVPGTRRQDPAFDPAEEFLVVHALVPLQQRCVHCFRVRPYRHVGLCVFPSVGVPAEHVLVDVVRYLDMLEFGPAV